MNSYVHEIVTTEPAAENAKLAKWYPQLFELVIICATGTAVSTENANDNTVQVNWSETLVEATYSLALVRLPASSLKMLNPINEDGESKPERASNRQTRL